MAAAEKNEWTPVSPIALCLPASGQFPFPVDQDHENSKLNLSSKLPANAEIGTAYRWTKNGWEDSSKWQNNSYTVSPLLDAVHPIVWAGLMLALALFFLFGLSSEADADDLFSELDSFLSAIDKPRESEGRR